MQRCLWITVSLLMVSLGACDSNKQDQSTFRNQTAADWVLTGGKIFTADDQNPWAEAVAVKGGKFIDVGDGAGVAEFVSDTTRKSELGGRLVIPDMVDSHTHPGYIDLRPYAAPLPETSKADILTAVKEYAEGHPDSIADVETQPTLSPLDFEIGKAFPLLAFPSLESGDPMSLADFRGEKVVLQIFASW